MPPTPKQELEHSKADTGTAWTALVDKFVKWAENRPDIIATAILGSQARNDHPADEWSDMDILVVTTNPEPYLASEDWIRNIGNPWITFLETTGTGNQMERRVLFEGGLDVDLAIIPQEAFNRPPPEEFLDMARRGVKILTDKYGFLAKALDSLSTGKAIVSKPSDRGFLETVNDFWYHAVWTARKLRRGELWTAKACCDSYMKRLLLRMMEWQARATRGLEYDTWHSGRFLEEWADPRAVEGLRKTFAYYDQLDVKRALLATMEVFRWLAKEAAKNAGYEYPTASDEHATRLVERLLSQT